MVAIPAEFPSSADTIIRDNLLGDAMRTVPGKYGADAGPWQARDGGYGRG